MLTPMCRQCRNSHMQAHAGLACKTAHLRGSVLRARIADVGLLGAKHMPIPYHRVNETLNPVPSHDRLNLSGC